MQLRSARMYAGLALATSLSLTASLAAQPGSFIGQIPAPNGVRVTGLGTTTGGDLWVTGVGSEVREMTPTGTVLNSWTASNSGFPWGITQDAANAVYIVDSDAATGGPDVDVYDATGNYSRSFPLTGMRSPSGIVLNPLNNHLYVVDRIANLVNEYNTQGAAIGNFAIQGTQPDGIGFDFLNNQFWVYQALGDFFDQYDSSFAPLNQYPGTTTAIGANGGAATFLSGVLYVAVRSQNTIVLFDTTGTSAGVSTYGTSCPQRGIFYEQFSGTGTGDLTGGGIRFVANAGGTGYRLVPGGNLATNTGPDLGLADDGILRNQALGFTFPFPGGAQPDTTAIDIAANGWIGLIPNEVLDTGFYVGASAAELQRFSRLAVWWDDLNPAVGGAVRFNTLSNPTRAVITWDQVPQFGNNDSNTLQVTLFPSGDFNMYWQAGCLDDAVVGFSSGNVPTDPGPIDLTASSFQTFGPYGAPLTLGSSRPIVGQTLTFTTTNIPSNAAFGGLIMGQLRINTPLDFIGMTGCTLLSNGNVGNFTFSPATGTLAIPIANDPAFLGQIITNQTVVIAPGVNQLGALASNGLELRLGT